MQLTILSSSLAITVLIANLLLWMRVFKNISPWVGEIICHFVSNFALDHILNRQNSCVLDANKEIAFITACVQPSDMRVRRLLMLSGALLAIGGQQKINSQNG